jgi:hypothetical protein
MFATNDMRRHDEMNSERREPLAKLESSNANFEPDISKSMNDLPTQITTEKTVVQEKTIASVLVARSWNGPPTPI